MCAVVRELYYLLHWPQYEVIEELLSLGDHSGWPLGDFYAAAHKRIPKYFHQPEGNDEANG